jgi:hypothetical protein
MSLSCSRMSGRTAKAWDNASYIKEEPPDRPAKHGKDVLFPSRTHRSQYISTAAEGAVLRKLGQLAATPTSWTALLAHELRTRAKFSFGIYT